jgi:cytochrome oxidase Cu insertion factor (SCO1/SenC/PrrC family)
MIIPRNIGWRALAFLKLPFILCGSFKTWSKYNMALPEIGSEAPGFSLPNQDGETVSLADYAGKNVIVWFYPRAFGGN